jgi:hypothetical protein
MMKRCCGSDQRIQAGGAVRTRLGAALPALDSMETRRQVRESDGKRHARFACGR